MIDFRALSTKSESETHPDIFPISCSIMHWHNKAQLPLITIVMENKGMGIILLSGFSAPLAEKMFA